MANDLTELKRKLDEATERLKRAGDPDDRFAFAGDVRDLEKQVEVAAAEAGEIETPRFGRRAGILA